MKTFKEISIPEKLVLSLFFLIIIFLGISNYNLNQNTSNLETNLTDVELSNYIQSENGYCNETLKTIDELGLISKNRKKNISYISIPLVPEIENFKCLNKISSIKSLNNEYIIEIYNNEKIFTLSLYSIILLILFSVLTFLKKDRFIVYIFSSSIVTYLIFDIFSFLSTNRFLAQLFTNLIVYYLSKEIIRLNKKGFYSQDSYELKKTIFNSLLAINIFSVIFLEYIFIDYFVYLCVVGTIIIFIITRIFNLKVLDAGLIILISHFALVINSVDLPLSRNHFSYMPNILSTYSNILSTDFQANITFPYPSFKFLTLFLIDLFGLNILNFLNFLTYFLIILFTVLFIYFLFPRSYLLISISYILLISRTFHKIIFNDYMKFENFFFLSNYSSNGLGDSSLITRLYEPTGFDILILPAIVLIVKNKPFWGFFILSISVIMHTYNIVPALLIMFTYFFLTEKINIQSVKVTFPLVGTVILFIYYYSTSYLSTPEEILQADKILTDTIMVGHRNFNYLLSLFLYTPFNINLDISIFGNLLKLPMRDSNALGFHFHLEIIIFTIFLLYKIKNIFLKRMVIFTFLGILFSIILSKANEYNAFGSLLRNVVPWKTSAIIYFLATIYFLYFIFKKLNKFNVSFMIMLLFLLQIYIQEISFNDYVTKSNNPTLNHELLRRDLNEISKNENQYTQKTNLTMRYDDGVIFKNFYPTTGNYFSHPYKPSEVIEWSKINKKILNFQNLNPTCSDAEAFLIDINLSTILFSEIKYVPINLRNCKQLFFNKDLDLYIFNNG